LPVKKSGGARNAALACGSKVLHLFFIDDFRSAGRKSSINGRKGTAAPELVEGLPKAETTFAG
jgi:hypothetical protein